MFTRFNLPRLSTAIALLSLLSLPLACGEETTEGAGDADQPATSTSATSNASTPGGGTTATPGEDNSAVLCDDDSGCAAGERCDLDAGLCRPGCEQSEDCPSDALVCDEGVCVQGPSCDDSSQCDGEAGVCNTCTGVCERAEASGGRSCQMDSNCFIEEFCDTCRGICRPLGGPCDPCQEDQECGGADDICQDFATGGRFCTMACATVSECPRGFECVMGASGAQCLPRSGSCSSPGECSESADCPPGQQCNQLLACVDGCTEGTCPNGEVCDSGACVAPCTSDTECPDGAECQPDGLCKVPGGCLTSRDCPEPGTYCDLDAQMCAPGCSDDSDCSGSNICRNGACGPRPCDGNYLCAFGQVCDIPTGSCVVPDDPYCEMCDAEAQNQCGGEPNQCLRLQDEDGNALGDFCGVACDPQDRNACPVGYSCEELSGGDMPSSFLCLRACYRDPV